MYKFTLYSIAFMIIIIPNSLCTSLSTDSTNPIIAFSRPTDSIDSTSASIDSIVLTGYDDNGNIEYMNSFIDLSQSQSNKNSTWREVPSKIRVPAPFSFPLHHSSRNALNFGDILTNRKFNSEAELINFQETLKNTNPNDLLNIYNPLKPLNNADRSIHKNLSIISYHLNDYVQCPDIPQYHRRDQKIIEIAHQKMQESIYQLKHMKTSSYSNNYDVNFKICGLLYNIHNLQAFKEKTSNNLHEILKKAATKIQSSYRGFQYRQKIKTIIKNDWKQSEEKRWKRVQKDHREFKQLEEDTQEEYAQFVEQWNPILARTIRNPKTTPQLMTQISNTVLFQACKNQDKSEACKLARLAIIHGADLFGKFGGETFRANALKYDNYALASLLKDKQDHHIFRMIKALHDSIHTKDYIKLQI